MSNAAESSRDDWLIHQWVAAGIVSAAARFVPIPYVDEAIQTQCRRFVISRTAASHQVDVRIEAFEPFYGSGGGYLGGFLSVVARAPLKLLLYPIRKLVKIVTSARGVPLEIARTILLGRTLDRCLARGDAIDARQAAAMRVAFDKSFKRMDLRVLRAAIKDSLAGAGHWKSAAKSDAKHVRERAADADQLETSTAVNVAADQVQEALQQPELLTLFAAFDRRFDEALLADS